MDKNNDDFKFPKGDYSWLIGLALIAGLFGDEQSLKDIFEKGREKYEQSNERSRTKPKS